MSKADEPAILLIDNDFNLVEALRTRLHRCGYRCLTAETGRQGLAQFQTDEIHLVITDINMPDGDGVALAKSIRDISDVPIVFITGFRDEYRRLLRNIPNVSVLRKPFLTQELLDVIETELSLRSSGSVRPTHSHPIPERKSHARSQGQSTGRR